jgi:RHS repeat-associated protein
MLRSAVVRKRAGPGFGCIGSANQVEDLYNGLGQLITEYQSHSGAVNTSTTPSVQYAYSFVTTSGGPNHSRLVSMTYPNGRVLNYNYNSGVDDRISRLSSISDSSATLEAYSYLGLNTVVARSHPQTGINQTYVIPGGNPDGGDQYTGLDRFGRVVEERWLNPNTNTVSDDFLYTYDRDGNRLTSSNALDSALSQQFSYDNLNQLATFTQGSHTESWSLDAVGNWLSFTDNGSTQTRTFNNQNQLTSLSGATTPTYDANGNTLTDDNGTRYSYDAWNRIVQVVAGSQIENFSYDALGRRDTIQNNSNFALDEYFSSNWQVIEEDQQGAVQNQFVWSRVYVDALVEQDSGSSRWYADQDANWNVTAMVTSTGSVANRFVYDPYGKASMYDASWNLQGGIGNGTWFYFFQGGRFDAATDLYNFRNRDYSTSLGRWMQEDPIAYKGSGPNLYAFVENDPIDHSDSSGLRVELWCGPVLLGFVHCSIVVICNGRSVRYDGGGGKTSGNPPNPQPSRTPPLPSPGLMPAEDPPANVNVYAVDTSFQDCDNEIKCLDKAFQTITQLPYNATGPNSNTYAHALLNSCNMSFKCFQRTGHVRYCVSDPGFGPTFWIDRTFKQTICSPPNALGWYTPGY